MTFPFAWKNREEGETTPLEAAELQAAEENLLAHALAEVALLTTSVFRPEKYGALGGGTDDTAAIQSAIAAAEVSGGTVEISKKHRIVQQASTNALTIKASNVTIDFAPAGELVQDETHTAGVIIQVNTHPATTYLHDVRIRRPKIDAGGSWNTQFIRMDTVENSGVARGVLHNSGVPTPNTGSASGVAFQGGEGTPLTISGITSASENYTEGTSSVTLGLATVTTEAAHGYAVGDYVNIWTATQAAYNGLFKIIEVPSGTTFKVIVAGQPVSPATTFTPSAWAEGVYTQGTRVKYEVDGKYYYAKQTTKSEAGYEPGTGAKAKEYWAEWNAPALKCTKLFMCKNCTAFNNRIYEVGEAVPPQAIYFIRTEGCKAVDNDCSLTGRGVFLDGPNVNAVVSHNTIHKVTDSAIRITAATLQYGSFIENRGHTVIGNTIDGARIDGIRFNSVNSVCIGNTIRNAVLVGIKSDITQNTIFANNIVENAGSHGIALIRLTGGEGSTFEDYGAHENVLIAQNNCRNCAGAGIQVTGGGYGAAQAEIAEGIRTLGNVCTGNAGGGIVYQNVNSGEIAENLCRENATVVSSGDKPGILVSMDLPLEAAKGTHVHHNRCSDYRTEGHRQGNGVKVGSPIAGGTLNQVRVTDNDVSNTPGEAIKIAEEAGTLPATEVARNRAVNSSTPVKVRSQDFGGDNVATNGLRPISTNNGDAGGEVTEAVSSPIQLFTSALTAERTWHLAATTNCVVGSHFRFVKRAGGKPMKITGVATLFTFVENAEGWADFMWTGSAWTFIAAGT